MVFVEFFAQLSGFLRGGNIVFGNDLEQVTDPSVAHLDPVTDEGAFFELVLADGLRIHMLDAEKYDGVVFLEILRQVEGLFALVALLIEVNGAEPELAALDIGRNVDHVIVGAHVAK